MVISLFSCDKMIKWDMYALSMPVTRRDMVTEKFIMSLILIFGSGLLMTVAALAVNLLRYGSIHTEMLYSSMFALLGGVEVTFFYCSIALPLAIWLGAEKARILPAEITLMGSGLGIIVLAFVTLLPVIMMVVSWIISIKLYEKKEF